MTDRTIGDCRLICGDALEALRGLASASVDAVVTDPPYGIKLRNGDVDGHRSKRWSSILGDDSQEVGIAAIEWATNRHLPIVAFASPWKPWPGRWRNLIVWDKGGAVGGGGDIKTCLKRSWELIQIWNPHPYDGSRAESVWRFPITPKDTALHIAAKPVPLLRRLIKTFTRPGDTILDPFLGSGSTAVACLAEGRACIGIERDPEYFRIACGRVEKAAREAGLFAAEATA